MGIKHYKYTRQLRLLTSADFKQVFDEPVCTLRREIRLIARLNGLDHPRLGFVLAKKRMKRAVDRNRLRRQIRENFRLNQDKLAGFDIVILANERSATVEPEQLRICLNKFWQELGAVYNSLCGDRKP